MSLNKLHQIKFLILKKTSSKKLTLVILKTNIKSKINQSVMEILTLFILIHSTLKFVLNKDSKKFAI